MSFGDVGRGRPSSPSERTSTPSGGGVFFWLICCSSPLRRCSGSSLGRVDGDPRRRWDLRAAPPPRGSGRPAWCALRCAGGSIGPQDFWVEDPPSEGGRARWTAMPSFRIAMPNGLSLPNPSPRQVDPKLANVPKEHWPPPFRGENFLGFFITAELATANFPGAHTL